MADEQALIIDVDLSHSNVESSSASAVMATKGIRWVLCLICSFGLATAFMLLAAAIYKAPAGVFEGHRCAYYVSVISSGVMGLAEACAAVIWLSRAADEGPWQRLACRDLLRLVHLRSS
ncbi:hypothetical protein CFC21_053827 [Triticum aestivum]|uniref:Uncharacterized protein n=2 Tax=Triticum aestivum TaxID=4565 RepID=A0A3B6I139_WHEAT|nr:hypothetical protein CFC21_053827 [Triticum aestivum]